MKIFLIAVLTIFSFKAFTQESFTQAYAQKAQADYSLALQGAVELKNALAVFLKNPTAETLSNAKMVWTEARKDYSVTEIYRFYGGPIDSEDGPEGLINAWPLDEVYIDYVKGRPNSGIINNLEDYPTIDKNLLIELNEKNGEKNISTGWHAIEFLLWGQDFSKNGPGERSYTDFVIGEGMNAERRRAYLSAAAELLVEHLEEVTAAWNAKDKNSFYSTFSQMDTKEALTKAFTSLISMSGDELAIERMFVAYDTQFQEDEHSCFSDTTHFDLLYNFIGIKNTWLLVEASQDLDSKLKADIKTSLENLEDLFVNFEGPFDQAIFTQSGRDQILSAVDQLQSLAELFKEAALELDIKI